MGILILLILGLIAVVYCVTLTESERDQKPKDQTSVKVPRTPKNTEETRSRLIRRGNEFIETFDSDSANTFILSESSSRRSVTDTFTVGFMSTQHPVDPRCVQPVKGLTEYVPIYSQVFLPKEHQLDLITMDENGNTNLKLGLYNGQLVLEAPNGLLPNAASGQIYKLGIYACPVRGISYYEQAIKNADTRPFAKAELVREPGNKYDKNAVAIYAPNAGLIGYVNKQNAARLAKRLDAGESYMALFTRGCKKGEDSVPVSVLIAPTATMNSILQNSGMQI